MDASFGEAKETEQIVWIERVSLTSISTVGEHWNFPADWQPHLKPVISVS